MRDGARLSYFNLCPQREDLGDCREVWLRGSLLLQTTLWAPPSPPTAASRRAGQHRPPPAPPNHGSISRTNSAVRNAFMFVHNGVQSVKTVTTLVTVTVQQGPLSPQAPIAASWLGPVPPTNQPYPHPHSALIAPCFSISAIVLIS